MSSLTGVIIEEMSSPYYYCQLIVEKMKTIKLTEILHASYDYNLGGHKTMALEACAHHKFGVNSGDNNTTFILTSRLFYYK